MLSYESIGLCYNRFLNQEWSELKLFYEENNFDVFLPHTLFGDSSLHLAVYSGNKDLVKTLLNIVYKDNPFEMEIPDDNPFQSAKKQEDSPFKLKFLLCNTFGNTPLHEAASIGNVEMVELVMQYDRRLLKEKNLRDETPFFMAALYGKTKVIQRLVKEVEDIDYHVRSKTSSMLHEAIRGYYFDTALELVKPRYHIDTDWKDNFDGMTCFQLLANIPSAFKSGQRFSIWEKLIYHCLQVPEDQDERENNNGAEVTPTPKTDSKHGFPSVQSLREMKKNHSIVEKLSKKLAKKDISWDPSQKKKDKSRDGDNTTDSPIDTPLIAAARNGIKEIVEAILDAFPQAIEHENHKKKTERPGEALRLQSDIQWFQRVKKMVPPHYTHHLNSKKLTPQALFTKEHKKLVKNGQEWLIRTTNSCIIVAVLIATVAFTSIYTVPGGSNPKTGNPLLLNTTAFTVFTAFDVASLCFAFTSVVVFLSITTSKMNEQDFRRSLPLKLVLGLSMLFLSVAALMVGFATTLVITVRHRVHQAAAPIIAIACFPVAFFLFLQLPLYANVTWYTIKDLLGSLIDFIRPSPEATELPSPPTGHSFC
ncbi:hypothetical protein M0R45_012818 [Rubus argutus]|uniref:PGG domain-containing protein n=1 Tax=Rubus argutus TaxID=59490 RepID=A0AAW1XI04_RUBAR